MSDIVADSGPLITFARVNQLGLLRTMLPSLVVPEAVYQELAVRGTGRPGAAAVARGDWVKRASVTHLDLVHRFPRRLHLGEREAIALAVELELPLLIDELAGRSEATQLEVTTITSLAILHGAKLRGFIPATRPLLDQMIATSFYLDSDEYERFLTVIGEWDSK